MKDCFLFHKDSLHRGSISFFVMIFSNSPDSSSSSFLIMFLCLPNAKPLKLVGAGLSTLVKKKINLRDRETLFDTQTAKRMHRGVRLSIHLNTFISLYKYTS